MLFMSQLDDRRQTPPPAKFFSAVMWSEEERRMEAERMLSERLGPIERRSEPYDFTEFSTYYDREMGGRPQKYFVVFERVFSVEKLVDVKLLAEEIQRRLAHPGDGPLLRTVNLDPGYVTGWNLVLSTVKNYAHRIHLGQGIYAEVTLLFRNGAFEPLPWTYRDYCSPRVIDFFRAVRCDYLEQLKNWSAATWVDGA